SLVASDVILQCPVCATPNVANARFCGSCGTRLHFFCWSCGTPALIGQQFCQTCGVGLALPALDGRSAGDGPSDAVSPALLVPRSALAAAPTARAVPAPTLPAVAAPSTPLQVAPSTPAPFAEARGTALAADADQDQAEDQLVEERRIVSVLFADIV